MMLVWFLQVSVPVTSEVLLKKHKPFLQPQAH